MNLVFDVDGTICFNGQYIEENLVKQIKKLQEHHRVIFASARPIRDLVPVVKCFNPNLLIGGNGSITQVDHQIKVIKPIQDNAFKRIKALIKQYNLHYIIDDQFDYAANVPEQNPIFRQLDPDKLANQIVIDAIEQPIKIILVGIQLDDYDRVLDELMKYSEWLSIHAHRHDLNIDITAKGINKYTTLQSVIGHEPYIAFGNDMNDIELLKNAKQSYFIGDLTIQTQLHLLQSQRLDADGEMIAELLKQFEV